MSDRDFVAYLDCSTGVSGDKFLGALLDAGELRGDFTAEHLRAVVAAIAPEARVSVERVLSRGVSALSLRVSAEGQPPHRHWSDIESLLESAALPEPVRENALRAFEALAIAEATVHGVAVSDVHFHEVGAIDSIVDIVGTCAGVHALGLDDAIVVGPVAVGSGTVETSHGVLPVPAPATAISSSAANESSSAGRWSMLVSSSTTGCSSLSATPSCPLIGSPIMMRQTLGMPMSRVPAP
jgi:hypothetical protein